MIDAASILVTTTHGLTFAQLCDRLHDHPPRLLWLVLRDEIDAGRVECDDGRYSVVPSAFDRDVFEALRQLDFGGEVYE